MFKKLFIMMAAWLVCVAPTIAFAQDAPSRSIRSYGLGLPTSQVFLRASFDGDVESIHFKEGQKVTKGDVIVALDCRTAKARKKIARLEAEATGLLQSAQAELDAAQSNYVRHYALKNQNATSEHEYSDSQLRLARAKAALKIEQERREANRARYELAEAEMEKYLLRAPFSGQITQVRTSQGAPVSDAMDLVQIVSMDSFRVELFLPVAEADRLTVGESVHVQVGAPFHKRVEAAVAFRSPMIESVTGTTRVVLNIDNRNLKLPSGLVISLVEPVSQMKSVASENESKESQQESIQTESL